MPVMGGGTCSPVVADLNGGLGTMYRPTSAAAKALQIVLGEMLSTRYQMPPKGKKRCWQVIEIMMVDLVGIEPTTSSMPWKRAPSCATGPLERATLIFSSVRIDSSISGTRLRFCSPPPMTGHPDVCTSRRIRGGQDARVCWAGLRPRLRSNRVAHQPPHPLLAPHSEPARR